MMWSQQIASLASYMPEQRPVHVPKKRRPRATVQTVLEQLDKIRSLLKSAIGNALTTRAITEELNISVKCAQLRLSRLREGGEVKMLAQGFNESAIWRLLK
jgi:hypothetical protein